MKHIPANLPFGVNEFALPPLTKNPHSKILISGVFSVLLIGGVISKFNKIETGSEISTERESVATKIARTLGIHKKSENTAGKITESEYQITLPLEVRANLVEKTRKVVFPGLTFEAPNPDSQGIYSQLKISELTAEHLASLVTYSASSKTKNQYGGFSLLFLVGAQSESLTHPDIYLDQKVVVTLPNSEIQTANSNTGIQILTMDDVIPPNIQHLESGGKIYTRDLVSLDSATKYAELLAKYQNGRLTLQSFLKERQNIERNRFLDESLTPLNVRDGMVLRLISEKTYNQAKNEVENENLVLRIEEIAREKNYLLFERKYSNEIKIVSKKFPNHTATDTKMLLKLIGRVNPDFSPFTSGGLARMSEKPYELAVQSVNHPVQRGNIIDELEILWSYYHTYITENPEISAVAKEANQLNRQAKFTDKTLDIEQQVRGLFFILKTFLTEPPPPTPAETEEFRKIVQGKLGKEKEPTEQDIRGTYLNYAYLLQLQTQGIIPQDVSIERTDIISMSDFVASVNDLASYLGIDDLRIKNGSLLLSNRDVGVESTIRSLSKYFWFQAHTTSNRLVTLCMINVRNGFSRLTGVKINGVGDMVEIHKRGIDRYAKEVEEMFEKAGAKEKFIGYSPDFGKSHFNAPEGANMGMLFTDTRTHDGKRGGHVSAIVQDPDGQWLVKDDYYKGQLGSFKTVQDFYSDKNPGLWKKYDIANNPEKLQGAIFFHGDLSKISFPHTFKDSTLFAKR